MRSFIFILGFVTLCAMSLFALNRNAAALDGARDRLGADLMTEKPQDYPVATLAGGCFWCLESELRALDGVLHTQVGYTGGDTANPTYQDITTGTTGHAEAVVVTFDPAKITYKELVTFFLTKAHDPTQLNRQGVDVGTQYRSAIFTHDAVQAEIARETITTINASGTWKNPIVTTISPAIAFHIGEEYHQQYYEKYEEETGNIHPRVIYKRMKE